MILLYIDVIISFLEHVKQKLKFHQKRKEKYLGVDTTVRFNMFSSKLFDTKTESLHKNGHDENSLMY